MFDPDDVYYIGQALPSVGAFVLGVALILVVGWVNNRTGKK